MIKETASEQINFKVLKNYALGPWFKVKRNKWTLIGIEWSEAKSLYRSRAM